MSTHISLILHKIQTPDGYSLSVEIIADAIQSVPKDAVESSWPVKVDDNGAIIAAPTTGN